MLSISKDKIDTLFELIGSNQPLYIPVDNNSGKADFAKWEKGVTLSNALKTTRSAKDFFFPKTEHMVSYEVNGQEVKVIDPRKEIEDFVIFGVRACDARAFKAIDNVYLKMDPVDSYYKNRREHGTVITLACNTPAKTCFCSNFAIDASESDDADVNCWFTNDAYFFKANTDKGNAFIEKAKSLLTDADDKAVEACKNEIKQKVSSLPFADVGLSKVGDISHEQMLKIFNSKLWEKVAEPCVGCGTCTYVCPTCMCFDVRDFATNNGVRQIRCWDSCMYNDFTQMAAENPRHTQKERSRQRFMHKLVYYPMAHEGMSLCMGCGRCVESCPVNMNILKVIKEINADENIGGTK